jgi:hypothetical protein
VHKPDDDHVALKQLKFRMKTLLLLVTLMYSGGRMIELVDHLQHGDLTAHGATHFCWLALAIVKPATLAEVLPRCVCACQVS